MTLPFLGFAALLGVVAIVRVGELVVSRIRMARKPQDVVQEPWLFPLMVATHVGLLTLPLLEVQLLGIPFRPWLAILAGVVLVLATVLRVWTLYTIGGAWNVRVVRPGGDQIATTGPYRFIRHPNYLVVILEIVALPLVHGAVLSAVGLTVLNGIVLFRRIRTEEATLSGVPAWVAAMADKKRLIPGVF